MEDRIEIIVEVERVGISEEEKLEWQERMIAAVNNAATTPDQCRQLEIEISVVKDASIGEIWNIKYSPKINAFLNSLEITTGFYPDFEDGERFLPNGDVLWMYPCDTWSENVLPFKIVPRSEWEDLQRKYEEQARAEWDES